MTEADAIVERILTSYATIAVVGASVVASKAAHSVPAYMQRLGWRIIPVNPHADEILGEPVYRTLADVPGQVGLVQVFRPSWQAPDTVLQAVAAGATALWLQLDIASAKARAIAEGAGPLPPAPSWPRALRAVRAWLSPWIALHAGGPHGPRRPRSCKP